MPGRLEQLEQLVRQHPDDTFLRYAIAMEYVSAGRLEDAAAALDALIERDPDYSAAYHQAGRVAEKRERFEDAARYYKRGIEVAGRQGDLHAKKEMQEALMMIE